MDCSQCRERLYALYDGELSPEEEQAMHEHLQACAECQTVWQQITEMLGLLHNMEPVTVPEDFRANLMRRLQQEHQAEIREARRKTFWSIPWRAMAGVAAALVLVVVISQFGGRGFSKQKMSQSAAPAPAVENKAAEAERGEAKMQSYGLAAGTVPEAAPAGQPSVKQSPAEQQFLTAAAPDAALPNRSMQAPVTRERKVIKNATIELSVESFDAKFQEIVNLTNSLGGFVANSDTWVSGDKKGGQITLRVPEVKFYEAINNVSGLGKVIRKSLYGDDITQQYIDQEARLKNLRQEEQRFSEILQQAKNVDEILRVENEIFRVRGEIEAITAQLQYWDHAVSLSTIQVTLTEQRPPETKLEPQGFAGLGRRMVQAFIGTTNRLIDLLARFLVLIGSAGPVLILILFGLGGYALWRGKRKKK